MLYLSLFSVLCSVHVLVYCLIKQVQNFTIFIVSCNLISVFYLAETILLVYLVTKQHQPGQDELDSHHCVLLGGLRVGIEVRSVDKFKYIKLSCFIFLCFV